MIDSSLTDIPWKPRPSSGNVLSGAFVSTLKEVVSQRSQELKYSDFNKDIKGDFLALVISRFIYFFPIVDIYTKYFPKYKSQDQYCQAAEMVAVAGNAFVKKKIGRHETMAKSKTGHATSKQT